MEKQYPQEIRSDENGVRGGTGEETAFDDGNAVSPSIDRCYAPAAA